MERMYIVDEYVVQDTTSLSVVDTLALYDAFSTLSSDLQATAALEYSGFKQIEIATILGVSRTTVWQKKKTYTIKLKEFLNEKGIRTT